MKRVRFPYKAMPWWCYEVQLLQTSHKKKTEQSWKTLSQSLCCENYVAGLFQFQFEGFTVGLLESYGCTLTFDFAPLYLAFLTLK